MQYLDVQVAIPAAAIEAHYRGQVQFVKTTSLDGRSVQFPANILRTILQQNGIFGQFRITYDNSGKFQHILPLTPRR